MSRSTVRKSKAKERAKVIHHPVKVVIRCRPFSEKEISIYGREAAILLDEELGTVDVLNPKNKTVYRTYAFDGVYGPECTQEDIYVGCCKAVTDSILDGYNGFIIAYGQTGTGKTFTMEETIIFNHSIGDLRSAEQQGMMCRVVKHIFSKINMDTSMSYQVNLSYMEIYQDTLRDLLKMNEKKLKMREVENGIYVDGLSNVTCKDFKDVLNCYNTGKMNRRTRSTYMSISSSRSHTILRLTVTSFNEKKEVKTGVLNMVDLGGSESQRKAGTKGQALKEGSKMNSSLSTLRKVVSMISSGNHRYIPYRDCKLTRVLQESLGGNCFTTILATIGPCVSDLKETMNTLHFSAHARNLKKAVKANFSPRCGEGALIKDKIRSLNQEEFKVFLVQELIEKLRLIRRALSQHPNDQALQNMESSCKNKINQILWMHEEINEVLGNKYQLKMKNDKTAGKDVIRDKIQTFHKNQRITRKLFRSIERFQQEINSIVTYLNKEMDEMKQLPYEEDLNVYPKISFSESNLNASRTLSEPVRLTRSETNKGTSDLEKWRRSDFFYDQKDQSKKPEFEQARDDQRKVTSLSDSMPKTLLNKSTQIFIGDMKDQYSCRLCALDFQIDIYQLELKFLQEAKNKLKETNERLKRRHSYPNTSSISNDHLNCGIK